MRGWAGGRKASLHVWDLPCFGISVPYKGLEGSREEVVLSCSSRHSAASPGRKGKQEALQASRAKEVLQHRPVCLGTGQAASSSTSRLLGAASDGAAAAEPATRCCRGCRTSPAAAGRLRVPKSCLAHFSRRVSPCWHPSICLQAPAGSNPALDAAEISCGDMQDPRPPSSLGATSTRPRDLGKLPATPLG